MNDTKLILNDWDFFPASYSKMAPVITVSTSVESRGSTDNIEFVKWLLYTAQVSLDSVK
jgi:hypothetical protein